MRIETVADNVQGTSNVLKSDLATKISIKLIEIFVQLRRILNSYSESRLEIEQIKTKRNNQDKNMGVVFQYLDELAYLFPKCRNSIYL